MRRITRILVGLGLLAMLCGQNGSTDATTPARSRVDSPASVSPAADPLVGEWRQDFSCQDNVETFHRLALVDYDEAFYRKWVRSDFAWGSDRNTATELTPEALCKGARPLQDHEGRGWLHHVVRVPDQLTWHRASYELLNDHTFTATDERFIWIGIQFMFKIVGDRLAIVLHRDPLDPWNGVPLVRSLLQGELIHTLPCGVVAERGLVEVRVSLARTRRGTGAPTPRSVRAGACPRRDPLPRRSPSASR